MGQWEHPSPDRGCRSTAALRLAASCLLLLIALPLFSAAAHAQEARFQQYGPREGLPQQQVLALHQDVTGYLWAGTYGGLGRYNGREFRVFSTAEGLASNTVLAIASSADGTVWAGTTRGLCWLAPRAQAFDCAIDGNLAGVAVQALLVDGETLWAGTASGLVKLPLPQSTSASERLIPDLSVTSLARDAEGLLWAGTQTGLLRLGNDGGGFASVHLPVDGAVAVSALLASGNRLWIGTSGGLLHYAEGRIGVAAGQPAAARGVAVSGLAIDTQGEIWASTARGVLRGASTGFVLLDTSHGLANQISHSILADREGIVWIGNDGGLNRFIPGSFVSYTTRQGLLNDFVRTLAEDARGRLWLGTRQGVQVVEKQGGSWAVERGRTITTDDGLVDPRIYDIGFRTDDEAWMATAHGVAVWREGEGLVRLYTEQDGLPGNQTRALHFEPDGRVWIGTTLGVALKRGDNIALAADPLLAQARVLSIRPDTRGRLWFGSLHHGLLRLDPNGNVTRYNRDNGLTSEIVWDIAPDAQGGVWVGSNGDGLFHIDAEGRIQRWTTANGLVDNFIWQLLVDDQGQVWSYTNRGLSRFDGTGFWTYTEQDGLTHLEGSATASLQTRSGERWFASAAGLVRYEALRRASEGQPPPIVIERAQLGGQDLEPGSRLPYGARNLAFEFAALTFDRAGDLRYRYRLRGIDDAWSEAQSYRPITFASLAPGDFVFEVQARSPSGEWSATPASFAFQVATPLWARPWFWTLLGLVALGLLWTGIRFRIQQVEARRRELEGLVRERTLALEKANQKLEEASLTDPLTGLANRRYLTRQVATDVAQSRRAYRGDSVLPNRDIIFLMVDIDHFKQINDTWGHLAGDEVLRQFAALLRSEIRESDYVVRWGGEEFLIVARQTEAGLCSIMAERIVNATRAKSFTIDDSGRTIQCTCSVGVSHFPFCQDDPDAFTWEQVLDMADASVYLAKTSGRDGWMAVRNDCKERIADTAAFVTAVKSNPTAMAGQGRIRIEGTHAASLMKSIARDPTQA